MYGWELPSRASYNVKKYDVLVSKLEGKLSFCVVLVDDHNIITTNGLVVIRPTDPKSLMIILSNIMTKEFHIQHEAFLTGSIMACLNDSDVGNFLIDINIDFERMSKILDTLELFQSLNI